MSYQQLKQKHKHLGLHLLNLKSRLVRLQLLRAFYQLKKELGEL